MANSIDIKLRTITDTSGVKTFRFDVESLDNAIKRLGESSKSSFDSVRNWAQASTAFSNLESAITQVNGVFQDLSNAYKVQLEAETKIETVMRQRMAATDEEVRLIKDLASAQQNLGIIGDEVQLHGAQQLATFLNQRDSLNILIPAMNNLVAQQKGFNVSAQDAVSVGNLMGKVMQGQASSLTEVGITFTEAQEKVLKYGNESERAAMLAEVITDNVGEMNKALAATDAGKVKQLENDLGDQKEIWGQCVQGAMKYVTILAQLTTAISGMGRLYSSVRAVVVTGVMSAVSASISGMGKAFVFAKRELYVYQVQVAAARASIATTTGAIKLMNIAIAASPWILSAASAAGLIAGIMSLSSESSKAEQSKCGKCVKNHIFRTCFV